MLSIAGSAYMAFLPTPSFTNPEIVKTSSEEVVEAHAGSEKVTLKVQKEWLSSAAVPNLEYVLSLQT